MKNVCFILFAICLTGTACEREKELDNKEANTSVDTTEQEYDFFENHDISACEIENPLKNMEWLKKYCKNLNEKQDFSSVRIDLYKVIDTDEHIFKIGVSYSESDDYPFAYSENWRNCIGELVFNLNSGVSPNPELVENFMKDKEFVAELFHFVKQ